jgi:hypothetical protein
MKLPIWIRHVLPHRRHKPVHTIHVYPIQGVLSHMLVSDICAVLGIDNRQPSHISSVSSNHNPVTTIRLHFTDKIAIVFDLDRRPIFSVENHSTNLDPKHSFHFLDVTARIWYIGDGYSAIFNLTLIPTDIQVISNSLPSRTILLDMTRS